MTKFQVNLTEHATDDLKDISKEVRGKNPIQALRTLRSAPFPSGTHVKRP